MSDFLAQYGIWIAVYLAVNFAVLMFYGYDKIRAEKGRGRVSEKTLLGLSIFGPFGALVGMYAFRHKTRKIKFVLVYVFCIIHIAVICALVFGFKI